MLTTHAFDSRIRSVLAQHGRVPADAISPDADLYDAGMTSHSTVNVMLGLENEFDIEFPDDLLNRKVFSSIASIRAALLAVGQPPAGS